MITPPSNNSQFSIQKQSAGPSLSVTGGKISRGVEKTRLIIAGGSSKFNIAAKTMNKDAPLSSKLKALFTRHRFVEIKPSSIANADPNQRIFLNINSIAKRCHLTKSEIRNVLEQKGGDEKLLALISSSAANTDKVLKNYAALVKSFSERRDPSAPKAISSTVLLKTIQLGMRYRTKSFMVKENNQKFLATYNTEKNSVDLSFISKKLGAGTFGNVYSLVNMESKEVEALKIAKIRPGAGEDLQNENTILKKIHQDGRKEGIQVAPRQVVSITVPKNGVPIQKIGLLEEKYDGDYSSAIKPLNEKDITDGPKWRERLPEFHQLLAGLSTLSEKDITHGDLKPQNILVKKTDGYVHIADLGGAKQHSPESGNDSKEASLVHTSAYTLESDLNRTVIHKDAGNQDLFIASEKARDVFSMGVIFYQALTGKYPYRFQVTKEGRYYPDPKFTYKNIPGVPDEMNALIKGMLAKEQGNRLTASDAFGELNRLMDRYP